MRKKSTLKGIFGSLALLCLCGLAAEMSATTVTITDNKIGQLASNISNSGVAISDITELIVTGDISARDMTNFGTLTNLEILDITGVTVVDNTRDDQYIQSCSGLRNLTTVKLPSTITTIEMSAFSNCSALTTINLDNVDKIKGTAFMYCRQLAYVNFDNVKEIGGSAFQNCSALNGINLENVKTMESSAFQNCSSLTSVNLKNLKEIPGSAFSGCTKLTDVVLSSDLKRIENNAFSSTGFTEFTLPGTVEDVSYNIFSSSQIEKIYCYALNKNINYSAFAYVSNLTDVYLYDPIPNPDNNGSSVILVENSPKLHVPDFALDAYLTNNAYSRFGTQYALTDDIDNLDVYRSITIDSTIGLADNFDMILRDKNTSSPYDYGISFYNSSNNALKINNFTQYATYSPATYYSSNGQMQIPNTSTFLSEGDVTAENINLYLSLSQNSSSSSKWNFISFPYTVNVGDIVTPNEALWVIREYDGELRANNQTSEVSRWKNVTSGQLEAGKGYILSYKSSNGTEFLFPAVKDENINTMFSNKDVKHNLNYWPSQYAHNTSWNLVGNPYDSFFDIDFLEYGAQNPDGSYTHVPVTIWNGLNYEAYSADDKFLLRPFEAFFIQGIDKDNLEMVFSVKGKTSFTDQSISKAPAKDKLEGTSRSIFNISVNGFDMTDRTRLVINEAASIDYEIVCDAGKFMSIDAMVPQIYMIENNAPLSINERPLGEGVFAMGLRFGAEGAYSISMDIRNASEYAVTLVDTFTGKETDLCASEYSFTTEEGTYEERFILKVAQIGESAINGVEAAKAMISVNGNLLSVSAAGEINVYSIDGTTVAAGKRNLETTLSAGIYVVKANGRSSKVIVK